MITDRSIEPISNVTWVHHSKLKANHWNPNRVATPELVLLEESIISTGWVQPVLATTAGTVVDGHHRWSISADSKSKLFGKYAGVLPVCFLDISEREAMITTVRMNRAKGTHAAVLMHELVFDLVNVHCMSIEDVSKAIGGTKKEVTLLLQRSIFKSKGLDKYKYSKAWIARDTKIHGPPSERDKILGAKHGQDD